MQNFRSKRIFDEMYFRLKMFSRKRRYAMYYGGPERQNTTRNLSKHNKKFVRNTTRNSLKHNKKFVKTQQEICPKHNKKFAKTHNKKFAANLFPLKI